MLDGSKRAKNYGISQADMYQLYAYGHKFLTGDQKRLMLIYPMNNKFKEPLPVFKYVDGFELWAVPFDLQTAELSIPESHELLIHT